MTAVKCCLVCGSPEIGPHCDNKQCTWWKCRRPACQSVGTVDGKAVVDNRRTGRQP